MWGSEDNLKCFPQEHHPFLKIKLHMRLESLASELEMPVSALCYHAWHFTWVGDSTQACLGDKPFTELTFILILGRLISRILSLTSLMACPLLIYRHTVHCA